MKEMLKKFGVVAFGAFIAAVGMNLFLIPADVYSGGFTGLAQLLSRLLQGHVPFLSTGVFLVILNLPIAVIAWVVFGRMFTIYSFSSVALMTLFLEVIPVVSVSDDMLLNAVFGGVIAAAGVGITLRVGASTGGLDVIAILMARAKGKTVGSYSFIFNAFIVVATGALLGWEKALYTIVSIYAMSTVIDKLYTAHAKLTAMIVTSQGEEMARAIQSQLVRGITQISARGSFSKEEKDMLMIVLSRYELIPLQHIINTVDPKAFTNVVQTVDVLGLFRKD